MEFAIIFISPSFKLASMIAKLIKSISSIQAIKVFLITCVIFLGTSNVTGASLPVENQRSIGEVDTLAQVDSLEVLVNQNLLVLQRYGGNKQKWVGKGTLLKVYILPFSKDDFSYSSDSSFFLSKKEVNRSREEVKRPGKVVYRGEFESLVGDTLTILKSGRELKFDIDDLYQIKVFNELGARVFGNLVNVSAGVLSGYSGIVFVAGAIWAIQGGPFAGLILGIGVLGGGLGYLMHRLALIIRRNKYDLVNDWYIVRSI